MERIAFVVKVGALRIFRILHEPRRAVTIPLLHALDPQIRRLAHMGIGGDQLVGRRHRAPPSAPLAEPRVPRRPSLSVQRKSHETVPAER
jgi:hypothetical protein